VIIYLLKRYYWLGLLLALLAPLWIHAASGSADEFARTKDALIWTGVLLGCRLLMTKYPDFAVRGVWRAPTSKELKMYLRLVLGIIIIDYGSKAIFFRWDRPLQVEVFKNFGLHSVYHVHPLEVFHLILYLYFLYVFLVGALFFRFSDKWLDRLWLVSSTSALGGATALFGERLLFGGVQNSFYFAGPLMWLCPPCASPHFSSYAWTPADFFVHAAFAPVLILIASCFIPMRSSAIALDSQESSMSRLQ
jgi:hypothetical protein